MNTVAPSIRACEIANGTNRRSRRYNHLGLLQQEEWTVRRLVWAGVTALWLVTIPVVIGARTLSRWKVGLSRSPALVYVGAVLVGIGTGWLLLPIVLAIATGLVALRG